MALRLEQNLCLLRICSRNENIISDLLRARFLQCINLHFPSKLKLLCLQIHSHCERPCNASNTMNFPPNLALYSILKEKSKHCQLNLYRQLYFVLYPKPKLLRFLMEVNRLLLANISLLLAK